MVAVMALDTEMVMIEVLLSIEVMAVFVVLAPVVRRLNNAIH